METVNNNESEGNAAPKYTLLQGVKGWDTWKPAILRAIKASMQYPAGVEGHSGQSRCLHWNLGEPLGSQITSNTWTS